MLKQESQTVEFGENGGKYLEKEKYLLRRRRKTEKEKEKSTRPREIRGSTSWYLVVLGQYEAVLVGILC